MSILFSPFNNPSLTLQNHLVMAPLTRNRAIGNIPNALMAEYYSQRGSAGLIITEGTSPSANGIGYARMPGMYSPAQVKGWKDVTTAVHAKGAKIFVQLMHCGRVAHPLNLPAGARILAPSAIAAAGDMYTDQEGRLPYPVPQEMTTQEVRALVDEYVFSAKKAMEAGFDGVELHGANGYLLEQFIRATTNQRTDNYGGSIENRARIVLEIADAVIAAIGKDKVGIRLSPYGSLNDMSPYDAMESDYRYIVQQLNQRDLLYLHMLDHSSMGQAVIPQSMKTIVRNEFKGILIMAGGYNAASAEKDLTDKKADLIAVGRPFMANPDLPARWKIDAPVNELDMTTLYAPGPEGYTDYLALA